MGLLRRWGRSILGAGVLAIGLLACGKERVVPEPKRDSDVRAVPRGWDPPTAEYGFEPVPPLFAPPKTGYGN
jgi:hypothetical protein